MTYDSEVDLSVGPVDPVYLVIFMRSHFLQPIMGRAQAKAVIDWWADHYSNPGDEEKRLHLAHGIGSVESLPGEKWPTRCVWAWREVIALYVAEISHDEEQRKAKEASSRYMKAVADAIEAEKKAREEGEFWKGDEQ